MPSSGNRSVTKMQRWKEEAEGAKNRARREACSEAEVALSQGRVEHEAATAAIEMIGML